MTSPHIASPAVTRPGFALGIVLISQLMVTLDASIVNIALPDIASGLGFSPTNLSWVVNAYTLAFGGLLLLGARAGDVLGRRRVFVAGIALFSVASLVGGLAGSSTMLLIARAAQGVGGALAAPSALALLMIMFTGPKERTRALGWFTAVSIGGVAVGLIAGGLLTQFVSWRWTLFINVPIGVALIAVAIRALPETPRVHKPFDLPGALTSTLGMTALVYSLVRAASEGWGDPITVAGFIVGGLLLAAFVLVERRAEEPITPLRLFADRNRSVSYVARLLLVAGMMGMFFFLTQFLQDILGYSPLASGLAFLPLTVMVFASSQFSARVLTPRFQPQYLIVGGLLLSTAALLLLSGLSASSGYLHLLLPLMLFGLGNGTAFVPLTALSLTGVRPEDAGAGSGLVNVMQQVGGTLGLAIMVSVFGHASGAASVSGTVAERAQQAFVHGADTAFEVAAGFLAVTVLLVAVLVRGPRKPAASNVPDRPAAGEVELVG